MIPPFGLAIWQGLFLWENSWNCRLIPENAFRYMHYSEDILFMSYEET